jgi:DNA repair exonuclease SbcCD nuclease subunit
MTAPILISSDQHCHDWSAFSHNTADGVNSRLAVILSELVRSAEELKARGGKFMFLAGDLFHVRGVIKPSVFNPTQSVFRRITEDLGINVIAIAGNHDLEGSDATTLGNAMQTLSALPGFIAVTEPKRFGSIAVFPWFEHLGELRDQLKANADPQVTAIIHAPVNGVIKGIPDHGLEASELAALGYKRVFAGHYHDHKTFPGEVYSVGATTHQTWNDPGTKAGFLFVYPDRVEHRPSQAPLFVDLMGEADITPANVKGNYCRVKLLDPTEEDKTKIRAELSALGALGSQIIPIKRHVSARPGVSVAASVTIEAGIAHFVQNHLKPDHEAEVVAAALSVLSEARA